MHKLNEQGSLIIPLLVCVSLLAGTIGFGFWAYAGRQEYKNNVDSKIAEAVKVAETNLAAVKDAEYTEKAKSPYQTYHGPTTYGSAVITYPRSWSAYIDESRSGSVVVSGYFHPDFVPAINSETNFALRFEVVNSAYDVVLKTFEASERAGRIKVSAYRAPKVDTEIGSKLTGELSPKKQGTLVLLPLRDKTIKVWTEGQEFTSDFSKVLESFSFIP